MIDLLLELILVNLDMLINIHNPYQAPLHVQWEEFDPHVGWVNSKKPVMPVITLFNQNTCRLIIFTYKFIHKPQNDI
jgi:hypothetical protein